MAKILLLLDYDGTLTPIVQRPSLARLTPARKKALRQLAEKPGITMAIISGRQLSDIKQLVGIPHIIYVGNHGFEILMKGKRIMHSGAKRFIPKLKKIKQRLKDQIDIKGAWIEDKQLTLSLHYREVASSQLPKLRRLFDLALRPWKKMARITRGKKVFEIRPPFDWHKGKAVKWLIRELKASEHLTVYIGDDITDEDAFRALRGKGVAILVGSQRRTAAKTRLKNIAAVYRYLRGLAKK